MKTKTFQMDEFTQQQMMRTTSLSPNRKLYSTEDFLNLNSSNVNNDIIKLLPMSLNKGSHGGSSIIDQANSSTLQRNKSFLSISKRELMNFS
jgi:hypothetical protein